jgi:hypothetical protein
MRGAPPEPSVLRRRQEILEWLSAPDALQADSLPKFVEEFDAVPYLLSALLIAGAVMGTQAAHELAHRIVAARKGVRARPPACLQDTSFDMPAISAGAGQCLKESAPCNGWNTMLTGLQCVRDISFHCADA